MVLANGVPLEGPFAWFRRRIIPVGSFIIVTEPLGEERARAIMPGRRTCTTTQNIGHYFRMTADDRLVFGGRARFRHVEPDLRSQERRDPAGDAARGVSRRLPIAGSTIAGVAWST